MVIKYFPVRHPIEMETSEQWNVGVDRNIENKLYCADYFMKHIRILLPIQPSYEECISTIVMLVLCV